MRKFKTLLFQQIRSMLFSASTYMTVFIFLGFMAVLYLFALLEISREPSQVSPTVTFLGVFWVPVLFMVPLITMRTFSEERRMGTLGTLMTTSISMWQVVLAKFLAAYFFYVVMWLLTLSFPAISSIYVPGMLAENKYISLPQIACGYTFIFISGTTYIAIGIFASSLTRTTLVAGMLSFGMLFFAIVGSGLISRMPMSDWYAEWMSSPMDYLQTFRHLEDFSAALLDTRPFFLYISATVFLLVLTSLIAESKES